MSITRQVRRNTELALRKHFKKCKPCTAFYASGGKDGACCEAGKVLANRARAANGQGPLFTDEGVST